MKMKKNEKGNKQKRMRKEEIKNYFQVKLKWNRWINAERAKTSRQNNSNNSNNNAPARVSNEAQIMVE